jgi:HD superfamily phosphohydrolase
MYIKDIVYGDIEIPEKFKAVIDAPEFQRLRRITQLATANLVFPAANHTRFEHCIGTYHVMTKIVNHFIEFFQRLDKNIVFEENEKDAVLMAALLHDIGHGPFSHAFEQFMGDAFDHEAMTCRIIASRETEINRRLCRCFGDDFPAKVIKYIDLQNEYRENIQTDEGNDRQDNGDFSKVMNYKSLYNNFVWIFHQLVSSQLDADRMDYILRDAKETGVQFGNFNINDLISGMQVVFFENNYYVCILEKSLDQVEGYLYARYQMYRNVYMRPYKIFTEELFKKIIQRTQDLYSSGAISSNCVPTAIACLLEEKNLTTMDFYRLDDHVMMGAILDWSLAEDSVLSALSKSFLDRSGFEQLVLLSNKVEEVRLFKREFLSICNRYLILPQPLSSSSLDEAATDIFQSFYFWVENIRRFSVYDKNSTKIYIQCRDGLIKEFTDVSSFITAKDEMISVYYIHFELLHIFFNENRKKTAVIMILVNLPVR